jgi:hypothetical protein
VRDEAERLVAAAIAAVSLAARGLGGAAGFPGRRAGHRADDPDPGRSGLGNEPETAEHPGTGFATGSPECCVCPVCRVIAAMRDPSPDLAERLASGAGELATGVTGLLRAFGRGGSGGWDEAGGRYEGTGRHEDAADQPDDPWRAATTTPPPAPRPMAKKAVKKAVKKSAPPAREPGPDTGVGLIAPAPTTAAPTNAAATTAAPSTAAATTGAPKPAKSAKKAAKKVAKKTAKKTANKAAPAAAPEPGDDA